MDLEENIRIAAKEVWLELTSYTAFIRGAMSPEAKAYWYNEFKAEQVNTMLTDIDKSNYPWNEPVIMTGWKEYKEYMRDCPDQSFSFEDWKNMMTKYNQVTRKIVDEISQSVLGVAGNPIDIVLSEKWYRPNIFDNIDNDQQSIDIYKKHAKNGGIIIVGSDHPKILEAVIAMHKQGIVIKDTDDIVLKNRSMGITEQIKDVQPFVMHNIHIDDIVPPIDSYEKPWDTKKQKRNNYKKKRRK